MQYATCNHSWLSLRLVDTKMLKRSICPRQRAFTVKWRSQWAFQRESTVARSSLCPRACTYGLGARVYRFRDGKLRQTCAFPRSLAIQVTNDMFELTESASSRLGCCFGYPRAKAVITAARESMASYARLQGIPPLARHCTKDCLQSDRYLFLTREEARGFLPYTNSMNPDCSRWSLRPFSLYKDKGSGDILATVQL